MSRAERPVAQAGRDADGVPEIDLSDQEVVRDPFGAYGRARERSPIARLAAPGQGAMWVLTRHEGARAMLADPRFELSGASFTPPSVPERYRPYMRTMSEMEGAEHARQRGLVWPAFTARRAAGFRPRVEPLVEKLLDELPGHAEGGAVDLVRHFARPLPMDVICELVGVPERDRPRWREYGATVASGSGQGFGEAVPGIMEGAKAAVAARRDEPGEDLISDLVRAQARDGDRLGDTELVTLVWHLVLAGQTPANLIANAVEALLAHPAQLAALRADPALMPRAVEELTRWCGPILLSIPRYAREDVELHGSTVREGEPFTASVAAANRDPRVFTDPERLDVTRPAGTASHLGLGHGAHFCLGASLARVQTEAALTALLRRFPGLAPAFGPDAALRAPDPGTWRLTSLPVTL
ncbi:cytochrome P450 [Sphaerisporangium sp. TRM90804]|uniref:cytochrome P450 family protein n=1 Tax=Sphaerisporangium sp. TRM90804 TaxID=3031113 RepID=UPI0024472273|nr:cytochrome P450 [Sphaerisporangium sp. TRM90804]MDH2426108.1 cytochrome P450 [Sphaerisporangium sp. TRM90804]